MQYFFLYVFHLIYEVSLYDSIISRSSCPEVFCKKDLLKNFTKFTGKHLCQSLFFNKVAGWGLTKVFSCEFCEIFLEHVFYRTPPRDCFSISFYLWKQPLTAANAAVRRCSCSLKACIFIEKRLQHRCFSVNTTKFLRITFFCRTPLVADFSAAPENGVL